MKNSFVLIAVALICCSCSGRAVLHDQPDSGNVSNSAHRLQENINHLLDDSLLSSSFVGIKIISLEDSTTLFSANSNKLFHPASNMKLVTTAAGLQLLGPQFNFVTSITTDGNVSNGILEGNIYITGSGDPVLRTEHFDSLADAFRQRGITTISGNIIGDISYYDGLAWGSGWMWDDEPTSDAAFITPLTVNDNCVEISISPGKRKGDLPQISIEPTTTYFPIINNGNTSDDTTLPKLDVTRVKGENTFIVQGRISPAGITQQFTLSVWKPELFFLELFKERLSEHGVSIHGTIRIDSGKNLLPLFQIRHPLDSVFHQINKQSDNLGAENLLKTLSANAYGEPGSALTGLSMVKRYLQSIGIDTTLMILADGSGLSSYNLISPDAMVKLLFEQYNNKQTFRLFYESLPIAGIDGTLKNRMKGSRAEGNVHAKTGSLTGVSTLSGYVKTLDGHLLAFSIMCNHFPGEIRSLRTLQNNIMEVLASYKMSGAK
jgi:D-alanyl-D-alanine carboxypeptidase/D-alanyl-D-alanine-endopeptidase (penicillin-binding protein 4)